MKQLQLQIQIPNTVYHGTTTKHLLSLRTIDLNKCSKYADFGKGFYTTSNYLQALSFAEMRAKDHNFEEYNQKKLYAEYEISLVNPLIMEYTIETKKLLTLNNIFFDKPDRIWAQFIYNNRVGIKKVINEFHNWDCQYDFVSGHVADNTLAPLILDMKNGIINFEEFFKKIQPYDKKDGNQFSFHTQKSLDALKLKKAQIGGIVYDKTSKRLC